MRLIGIGDNVCDKYRTLSTMYPGGQALNVAVYCRMCGWDSAFLGAFGRDTVGEHVQRTLDTLGVDHSRCRIWDGENGYAVVDLVEGERVFVTSNKGGVLREHPLELNREDLEYIGGFDVAHTSNNAYLDKELPKLGQLPVLVSYDFSKAWSDPARRSAVCPYVHAAFLSCSQTPPEEVEEILRTLTREGCAIAVATMGEKGAAAWDGTHMVHHRPQLVQALDTLGAGDSFAAGFLMEYARVRNSGTPDAQALLGCMEAGAALSAKTCMTYGAFGYGCPMV